MLAYLVALCYRNAMSQPVKLSDALVLDARIAAEAQQRSIAGQVEFWAKLGQSIDHLLTGGQVQALRRAGRQESLSERLASVDSPVGRARTEAYLQNRPYPHYQDGGQPGLLLRIEEDGTETLGRFVNRKFVPVEPAESATQLDRRDAVAAAEPVNPSKSAISRKDRVVESVAKTTKNSIKATVASRIKQRTA